MSRKINVGIVGATGMVGEVFLELLNERQFPVGQLKLFGGERSSGETRTFNGQALKVERLGSESFSGLDLVFFSAGDDISKEWAPRAVASGAVAVDNSAAFRMNDAISLIVPEVNGHLLGKTPQPQLIANPNCSTIQLVMALAPLHRDFGIESVHVATYQSVSGAGREAQEALLPVLEKRAMTCVPQIGSFGPNGFSSEETKIMRETRKIMQTPALRVSAFAVRVPTWNGHSEAAWVRLEKTVDRAAVERSLKSWTGVVVEDDVTNSVYPTAVKWSGKNAVAVGRIHQDLDDPQTWLLWIVSDNLRKGAALNGIQIAERIFDLNARP